MVLLTCSDSCSTASFQHHCQNDERAGADTVDDVESGADVAVADGGTCNVLDAVVNGGGGGGDGSPGTALRARGGRKTGKGKEGQDLIMQILSPASFDKLHGSRDQSAQDFTDIIVAATDLSDKTRRDITSNWTGSRGQG